MGEDARGGRAEEVAANEVVGQSHQMRTSSRQPLEGHATHQTAVPRRPRRQPVAPGGAEGGARQRATRARSATPQLRQVEDREIEKIIKKQEEIGLKLATDGEFRRSWWQFDFYKGLDGVELYTVGKGIVFAGVETKAESVRVVGKVGFSGHPHIEHFKFVKAHTKVTPKMTIPAPSTLHFRQGRQSINKKTYPELDVYFDDVGKAYQKAIRAFYDAGCRYLQIDDTAWSMLCDPKEREQSKERGDDPDSLPAMYAAMTNKALQGKPADMVVTMHSCRGNFRSTFIASGGYEPIAEQLLGEVNLDGYFLEYDSERAGGFEPLRFLPKGKKIVVLGARHLEERHAGEQGRHQAADRRGDEVRRARPALSVAAMRLRLHRGGQRAGRGRAMGQAADDRGTGGRGGEVMPVSRAQRGMK